jgi:micrococcal nuclease
MANLKKPKEIIKTLILLIIISSFFLVTGDKKTHQKNEEIKNNIKIENEKTPLQTNESEKQTIKGDKAKVTRVIDGDTIEIETGEKVRYIGIDAPETNSPSKPIQCFGAQSKEKNKELVLGKEVILEKDVSEKDKYRRLLRYVWVDDILINELLVREGYAQSSTYPPDVKYQEKFLEAQRKAREENKGLWSACQYFGQPLNDKEKENKCSIKGNISKDGEKIYHLPNCASYSKTVIDESKGEKWFCSEEEAIKSGFRKAKNCP